MISAQAEPGSARLSADLHSASHMPNTDRHGASSPPSLPDIMVRLGGRFAADVADLLQRLPETKSTPKPRPERTKPTPPTNEAYAHQQFSLARLRAKNVDGAVDYIQRHAPELLDWLHAQLKRYAPHYVLKKSQRSNLSINVQRILQKVSSMPDGILIDAEAGRIARILGQFRLYRAWAFAHSIGDGDGWVERKEVESLWENVAVATSRRHARRIIQQGCDAGYWSQDRAANRIYLTGQVKVAVRLVERAVNAGYLHLVETNKPGKRRVRVDLSGSLQDASAHLYAAWLVAKDPDGKGATIGREMLCELWQVSVPTLLSWEAVAGIGKQANFAQQNDTSLEAVPKHAYLTLNRDGTYAAAWRLPNTYHVNDKSIQQHTRTGKATRIKQAIRVEIALAEQRGSIGDAALPRSGKRYFTDDALYRVDPFRACSDYLRRLSRRDGDVFQRRYFYVGRRHGVRIYEPYNIVTNAPETHIHQRLIWGENREAFGTTRRDFDRYLTDHHQYLALLS